MQGLCVAGTMTERPLRRSVLLWREKIQCLCVTESMAE